MFTSKVRELFRQAFVPCWWDLTTNQQSTIAPGATNPIIFDGNDSISSIEITQALTVVSMTVKNS